MFILYTVPLISDALMYHNGTPVQGSWANLESEQPIKINNVAIMTISESV